MIIGLYSPEPRAGKGTVAEAMVEGHDNAFIISFADILRGMVATLAGVFIEGGEDEVWEWFDDDRKDTKPIPGLGVTMRYLLQTLGTEWGRKQVDPEVWVKVLAKRIDDLFFWYGPDILIVVDDVRFPNEYEYLRAVGAVIIKVTRPAVMKSDNGGHVSNGLLDGKLFDDFVINNGTIEDLKLEAKALVWAFDEKH